MGVELVLGIALIALLGGAGVGYFLGKGKNSQARVQELESALETAQTEAAEYRREVYGEFAETAEKFRALDQSYQDLHRQLASSSVALCGDDATPLLAGPDQSALEQTDESHEVKDIAPAPESIAAQAQDELPTAQDILVAEAQQELTAADSKDSEESQESEATADEAAEAVEALAAAAQLEDSEAVKDELQDVPTLTDTDTDERRHSA